MTIQATKVFHDEKFKKCKTDEKEGKQWPQILAVCAVSLGNITTGMILVWSSPFSLKISQDKVNYNITEEEASYFIIFQPLGMIFASFFLFQVTEWLGRKRSVLLVAFPYLASWMTTIFAKSKWEFYAARFLGGIGDCCVFCTIPPYVGEITTPTVRGLWGNAPTFMLYGGQVLITVLGVYLDVRTTAYISILIPLLLLLTVSFLPESPYQLIREGKHDKAKRSISWLQRTVDVEEVFQNMKLDVERQMSESGNWKDLFTIDSNRRALRAGAFLRFSQQLCGISVFNAYTQTIFEKSGVSLSSEYSSMIFVGLVWICNLVCGPSVEKFGRKLSYFYSLLSSGIVLLSMATYFLLKQLDIIKLDSFNWFPLAGMVIFVFTFSFGLGVVPTLMLGELFSASIKSKGLCILMGLFGLSVFLIAYLFQFLSTTVGLYSPFLVYGVACLISTFLTLRWVPETKGKTLEEIQQSLKKIKLKLKCFFNTYRL